MMFPPPPALGSPNRRPQGLAPLHKRGSLMANSTLPGDVAEPLSPHYVPRGFSADPGHGGTVSSAFLLEEEVGPSAFDGLPLSPVSDANTPTAASPTMGLGHAPGRGGGSGTETATAGPDAHHPRLHDFFHLPPLLVVCLVRHASKTGEVLGTPQSVEQVVRDLQAFFSNPIPAEQIHKNKNLTAANAGGGVSRAQTPRSSLPNPPGSSTAPAASSSDKFHKAHAGSRVSLQFGKAVDVYSTGGSAVLNLFIYAVDEPTSRPRLMAEVAKSWREHLATSRGGGEGSCMVLLYHKDIVAAAQPTGSINKRKVEAAAAVLESYYSELRSLHFGPQQMAAYNPHETPVRLLERLRTACAERTRGLQSVYEAYHKAKRSLPLDPVTAKEAPVRVSSPTAPTAGNNTPAPNASAVVATAPAPATSYNINLDMNALAAASPTATTTTSAPQPSPRSGGGGSARPSQPPTTATAPKPAPTATWNVQQLWRLGYDLVLHYLQFGLVKEAQQMLQVLYVEYYNNSDDYVFVTRKTTLERLGRIPNLFDPRRSGTEPGKSGYPKVMEPAAELIDGLLFLAAGDMACWALLGNMALCKARYETFIQVAREKFAEEPGSDDTALSATAGIPRVLQQFFLLQCFLSGLRTFWPLYGLTTPTSTEQLRQLQQQQHAPRQERRRSRLSSPKRQGSPPIPSNAFESTTPLNMSPETALPTPVKDLGNVASPGPILTLLELDGQPTHGSDYDSGSVPDRAPSSPTLGHNPELTFSMIAPPPGFMASLPSSASRARPRRAFLAGTAADEEVKKEESFSIPAALRRMLHLDDGEDEECAGEAQGDDDNSSDESAAAARHSAALLQLAFDAGTDTSQDAIAYLVKLAHGVGFLPATEVPIDVQGKVSSKRLGQIRLHCVHIADLSISARNCLSYIGDALRFADMSLAGDSVGSVAAFSDGKSEAAVTTSLPTLAKQQQQQQQQHSPSSPSTSAGRECGECQKLFHNVEELQTPESGTRFWRILTVMAGVALRVAGQRRREFNLYTRLALTYLGDDPATTMRIAAHRLIPFIRDNGWWFLEYFVRRLYVQSTDCLIDLIHSHAMAWPTGQRAKVWGLLFATETTYALYKECILFLMHKAGGGEGSEEGTGAEDGLEIGSLDSRTFTRQSKEELWAKMLHVDAIVERPLFQGKPPEYPLEALVGSPVFEVRKVLEGGDGGGVAAVTQAGGVAGGILRVELDEAVSLVFTCRCPVNVIPSLSGRPTTIRAVLESRKDWEDPVESTHVVALADGELEYKPASGELIAHFRFSPCHAGFYRLRSIGLCNDATRLSLYPQRLYHHSRATCEARTMYAEAAEEERAVELHSPISLCAQDRPLQAPMCDPASLFNRKELGQSGSRCARVLLHVLEPASGIRLRVTAPPEEHCFADSLSFFTVHVDMEEPLSVPETSSLAPLVATSSDGTVTGTPATTFADSPIAPAATTAAAAPPLSEAALLSSPSPRDILQEKMKKWAKGGAAAAAAAAAVDSQRQLPRECVFEASPNVLAAPIPLGHSSSQNAQHAVTGSLRATSPANRSLVLQGHAAPPPGPLAGVGVANLSVSSHTHALESSLQLKTDASVVAVVHVAPPKALLPPGTSSGRGGGGGVGSGGSPSPSQLHARSLGIHLGSPKGSAAPTGTPGYPSFVMNSAHRGSDSPLVGGHGLPLDGVAAAASPGQLGSGEAGIALHGSQSNFASASATTPQFYNAGVTVEFATEPVLAATPGTSMVLGDGGAALGANHHGHKHHHHHHHHRHRDANSLSATRRSQVADARFAPLDMSPGAKTEESSELLPALQPPEQQQQQRLEDGSTSGSPPAAVPEEATHFLATSQGVIVTGSPPSIGSAAGLDNVRLAVHPAANLRCAGDCFTPVGQPGVSAGTQIRVTILGQQQQQQQQPNGERTRHCNDRHFLQHGNDGDEDQLNVQGHPDRGNATQGKRQQQPSRGTQHGRVGVTAAPRTIIPFDEAAVMNSLDVPTAAAPEAAAAATTETALVALPLEVRGSVSVYPRRECTFQLSVMDDDAVTRPAVSREPSFRLKAEEGTQSTVSAPAPTTTATANPLARTRHMVLKLPLLPLFMTRDQRGPGSSAMTDKASSSSPAPEEAEEGSTRQQQSTVSFTCLRGRETCTSTACLSFPFAQAISTTFAFRHFQSRVYCIVTLTNELERTSLWVRGIILRILDLMPTYEVVRVSGSYGNLLHREWKAKESLSVLYELALCRSFQPTEAVLHHRVHAEVFYSDWHRTYKHTPAAHRFVLHPMRLPETEAGAESVRIDDVSLQDGAASGAAAATLPQAAGDGHREHPAPPRSEQPSPSPLSRREETNQDTNGSIVTNPGGSSITEPSHWPPGNSPSSSSLSSSSSTSSSSSAQRESEGNADRSLDDIGRALRYNPVYLSLLSAMCNTYVSQEVTFRSKHLCLFSAVMYAESPWTTRFGAATNYASTISRANSVVGRTLSDCGVPGGGNSSNSSRWDTHTNHSEAGLMGDAMVDQPSDFRFIAGEPVRFCVRLEPNAHNWPEEADVEEDFFIQLQYDPQQWMVIGKQRERRTLSLMEDVTVNFTAVPLLPPAVDEDEAAGDGDAANTTAPASRVKRPARDGAAATVRDAGENTIKVRFAGNSVQDEGILDTPTIKLFWANQESSSSLAGNSAGGRGTASRAASVLIDVVRFRTSVKVYKKVR